LTYHCLCLWLKSFVLIKPYTVLVWLTLILCERRMNRP
jgi:hypothetical protein